MMWRLYVAAIPLLWFYMVSITYGNTNDTVVAPRQKAGQSAPGNPLQTTSTTSQDGSNANYSTGASPSAMSQTLYATDMASESGPDAKTPLQVAKDAARTLSPSPAASQTLRTASSRTTLLNESIITTLSENANGNQTLPTSEVGNRRNSTSDKDYLLTDGTTTSVPEKEDTTPEEMPLPRQPLDSVAGSRPFIEKGGLRNKTVELGEDVKLQCHVQSENHPEIWWEFNGIPIGDSAFFSIKRKPSSSVLKINGASLEHAGRYMCVARNEFGLTLSTPVYLVVLSPFIEKGGLRNKTVELGEDVKLQCHVQSENHPEIWWEFNGIPIGDSAFFSIKRKPSSSVLKINGASLEHAGRYMCVARNEFGLTLSTPVYLVVLMEPTIVKGPGDHSVAYGQLLNLSCTVEAFPPPKIAWFRNRDPLREWTGKEKIVINVTESAMYSCFYRNVIKGEDHFAAKFGTVTVTGVRPT